MDSNSGMIISFLLLFFFVIFPHMYYFELVKTCLGTFFAYSFKLCEVFLLPLSIRNHIKCFLLSGILFVFQSVFFFQLGDSPPTLKLWKIRSRTVIIISYFSYPQLSCRVFYTNPSISDFHIELILNRNTEHNFINPLPSAKIAVVSRSYFLIKKLSHFTIYTKLTYSTLMLWMSPSMVNARAYEKGLFIMEKTYFIRKYFC